MSSLKPNFFSSILVFVAVVIGNSWAAAVGVETCVVRTPEKASMYSSTSPYCDRSYNIAVQGEVVTLLSQKKNYVLVNSSIWNTNCFTEGLVLKPKGALVDTTAIFKTITSIKLADIYYDLEYRTGIGKSTIKLSEHAFANQLPNCAQIVYLLKRAGIQNPKVN